MHQITMCRLYIWLYPVSSNRFLKEKKKLTDVKKHSPAPPHTLIRKRRKDICFGFVCILLVINWKAFAYICKLKQIKRCLLQIWFVYYR
jgi:hypothetical protein